MRSSELLERLPASLHGDTTASRLLQVVGDRLIELQRDVGRLVPDRWLSQAQAAPGEPLGRSPLSMLAGFYGLAAIDDGAPAPAALRRLLALLVQSRGPRRCSPVGILDAVALSVGMTLEGEPVHRGDTYRARLVSLRGVPRSTLTGGAETEETGGRAKERNLALTEVPVVPASAQFELVSLGTREQAFQVHSESLVDDRPWVRITVPPESEPVRWPSLYSTATGEEVTYRGTLNRGDVLEVRPGNDGLLASPGWLALPPRSPVAVVSGGDGRRIVDSDIFTMTHPRFDVARFGPDDADDRSDGFLSGDAAPRFPTFAAVVSTPAVLGRHLDAFGERQGQEWVFFQHDERTAAYHAGADWPAGEPVGSKQAGSEGEGGAVSLELVWRVRRPATYRLRVPTDSGNIARDSEWLDRLEVVLDHAGPAGVRGRVELEVRLPSEQHRVSDRLASVEVGRAMHLGVSDRLSTFGVRFEAGMGATGTFGTEGRFDETWFEVSRLVPVHGGVQLALWDRVELADRFGVAGRFDVGGLGTSRLSPTRPGDGRYGEAWFDFDRFAGSA